MPATEHSSAVTCSTNAWRTSTARVHSSKDSIFAFVPCHRGGTALPFTPCSSMKFAQPFDRACRHVHIARGDSALDSANIVFRGIRLIEGEARRVDPVGGRVGAACGLSAWRCHGAVSPVLVLSCSRALVLSCSRALV